MFKIYPIQNISLLGLILLLFTFYSCKKKDSTQPNTDHSYDCEFVQNDENMDGLIDETERNLMNDCYENKLTSKMDIETNLIGEWELIGHGEGWTSTPSKPCSFMTISNDELTFEYTDASLNTTTIHDWEVIEQSDNLFILKVVPEYPRGINLSIYCDEFIYGDATARDGNMYLYQKKN